MTGDVITTGSGNVGSIQFKSQTTMDGGGCLLGEDLTSSTQVTDGVPDEVDTRVGSDAIEEVRICCDRTRRELQDST